MSVELEVSVTLLCVVEHQQNIEHQLQLIPPSSTLVSAQNQPRDSLTMQWHFTVRGYEDHLLPTLYDIWQCHWQLPMTTTQSPHWRSTQKRAIRTRRWCLLHLVTHSKTSQWRKVKEMLPVWLCTRLSSVQNILRCLHPQLALHITIWVVIFWIGCIFHLWQSHFKEREWHPLQPPSKADTTNDIPPTFHQFH